MRFGPDVEWLGTRITPWIPPGLTLMRDRSYWPGLPDNSLMPAYCGIRPKLSGPGMPQQDFMIESPAQHGLPGLVHLFGMESPGLTSSLSIADEVVSYL